MRGTVISPNSRYSSFFPSRIVTSTLRREQSLQPCRPVFRCLHRHQGRRTLRHLMSGCLCKPVSVTGRSGRAIGNASRRDNHRISRYPFSSILQYYACNPPRRCYLLFAVPFSTRRAFTCFPFTGDLRTRQCFRQKLPFTSACSITFTPLFFSLPDNAAMTSEASVRIAGKTRLPRSVFVCMPDCSKKSIVS